MSAAALSEALPLDGWQNFYVIVGSSAAALTGLTFIVITIAADASHSDTHTPATRLAGLRAFLTPTTVHFGSALWLSALLTVPGHTVYSLALCLGVSGLAGVVYSIRVVLWMFETLSVHKLFMSDWIWSAVLPTFAHVCLLAVALLLPGHPLASLYAVGAIALLLLFIGIHNAWGVVTWIATERHARKDRRSNADSPPKEPSGR